MMVMVIVGCISGARSGTVTVGALSGRIFSLIVIRVRMVEVDVFGVKSGKNDGGDMFIMGVWGIVMGVYGMIVTGINLRRRGARSIGTTVAFINGVLLLMVLMVGIFGKIVLVGGSVY